MSQTENLEGALLVGDTLQNKLLAALPEIDWRRIERHLSSIEAPAGKTLCEFNAELDYAYFPTTSIISLLHIAADGASTEIATIGNEGFVGVTLFMGGGTMQKRVVVQCKGRLYRLKPEVLKREFNRGGALQHVLLRYTNALLTQISQAAVCNRRHSIDQQLCRWMLQSLDRLGSEELTMTHELLANTLGVRREGITDAARKLQRAGLITYRRGRITVVDRARVQAYCCDCYGVVRRAYDRLPGPYAYATSRYAPEAGQLQRGHIKALA
jgi:CRP-like cAMP-binding protein